MARTIQQIKDQAIESKEADANLDALTNPSNASIWYNLISLVAVMVGAFEQIIDNLLDAINTRAEEIPVGTLKWYSAETLQYQHGYNLTLEDGIPVYAVEDETKKIVKQAAAVEASAGFIIKAGKIDGSGDTIKLTTAELDGLKGYWNEKRFAGSTISVVSFDPDVIQAYLDIQIDKTVIDSTGQSIENPGVYPIVDAIKEYYAELDFAGDIVVMSLVDAVQTVTGVRNVVPTSILIKSATSAQYTEILEQENERYTTFAGYLIEDPAAPLNTTISYV